MEKVAMAVVSVKKDQPLTFGQELIFNCVDPGK